MKNDILFNEITDEELQDIEGGSFLVFLGGAAASAAICIICDAGNEALKNKTGKSVGDWFTYGVGVASDKIGQGLSTLGNALQ